jgi:AcrR family transcriptional regulator
LVGFSLRSFRFVDRQSKGGYLMRKIDTKSLLAQSILELVQKKPVEKITVTDITNNCSLKRETFYYHFYDKYELIAESGHI